MSSEWFPIESAPKGACLVYLEDEMLGSRIQIMTHRGNFKVIGSLFYWDAPKPIKWKPLPEPPKDI